MKRGSKKGDGGFFAFSEENNCLRESFAYHFGKYLHCTEFRFIMPNVGQEDSGPVGCEVVIFEVTADVDVRAGFDSVLDEGGTGTTADGDAMKDNLRGLGGVSQSADSELILETSQEFEFWNSLDVTDDSETCVSAGSGGTKGAEVGEAKRVGNLGGDPLGGCIKVGMG